MTDESQAQADYENFLRAKAPNDLGNYRCWGWSGTATGTTFPCDIWWVHRCKEGKLQLGMLDVSTPIHQLVSEDPLHVEPSILCPECGDHGYIRDGQWVPA